LGLVGRAWPNRYLPFWPRLYEQQEIVDDNGDAPTKKHPKEPRMGGVPDQVEGGKPDNDDDKDGKMDKETAQRRFCEPELLRRIPRSFRHQTTPCYLPTRRVHRTFGRSPVDTETTRAVPKLHAEKDSVFTRE